MMVLEFEHVFHMEAHYLSAVLSHLSILVLGSRL